jgi:hypothetical protein
VADETEDTQVVPDFGRSDRQSASQRGSFAAAWVSFCPIIAFLLKTSDE